MNRYLIPIQQAGSTETIQRISVDEDPVGIYRLDDDTYRVVAEQNHNTIELGPKDASVSRKKNGTPPVELSPTNHGIEVKNRNSTNPISVDKNTGIGTTELDKGEWIEITEDCIVELGFDVKIRANVRSTFDTEVENSPTEGVELHVYVNRVTDNVEQSLKRDDVTGCRNYMQELLDTLIESPVDAHAYDEVKSDVEKMLDSLEKKVDNKTLKKSFDDQKQDQIQHIIARISDMYEKN